MSMYRELRLYVKVSFLLLLLLCFFTFKNKQQTFIFFFSDFTFQWCIWWTRWSTQSWLCMETVIQMFRMLEEIVLHPYDHILWNLYRCWMGMWICLHCLLAYMDHLTSHEDLWNELWYLPENLRQHCELLCCTLLRGLWSGIPCI